MEAFLCAEGYLSVYERNVSPQKKSTIEAKLGTLDYCKQVSQAQPNDFKLRNAAEVIEEMERRGKDGVPQQLRIIIEQALELALPERTTL